MQNPTTIIKLTAENVKRLKAVEIIPTGSTVIVGGRNAQGKTSLLDCITMALGGAAKVPGEPIRRGASKGQIILETQELTVTRKFHKSGTTSLEVTNKEGLKYAGPQQVLDKLCATLAFDPLAFIRSDKKSQFKLLQDLLGIDTASLDATRRTEMERRTSKNRDVKALAAVVASLPASGPSRVEVSELLDELSRAETMNGEVGDLEREAMEAENQTAAAKRQLTDVLARQQELHAMITAIQTKVDAARAAEHAAKVNAQAAEERANSAARIDTAPIKARIGDAEEINAAAAKVMERKAKAEELEVLENESEMMTAEILKIDTERAALLANAKMPVPGIGFDADGVTLNGLPLEQASSAEQWKLGLSVACAMNPSLRVMLIRDGSLLDDESMAMVAGMATTHGAQVWIERVGNDGKCTVIIEDGEVASEGPDAGKPAPGVESPSPAAPKTAQTEPAGSSVPEGDDY